jgi:hypothetical protein
VTEESRILTPLVPRLLTKKQAAAYCGVSVPTFNKSCPVSPSELYSGLKRYDRKQLDAWMDNLSQERGKSFFDCALEQLN